jgi:predicted nucleic acid-binding Zn ribbon protein
VVQFWLIPTKTQSLTLQNIIGNAGFIARIAAKSDECREVMAYEVRGNSCLMVLSFLLNALVNLVNRLIEMVRREISLRCFPFGWLRISLSVAAWIGHDNVPSSFPV